jgi:hypothetical protein
MIAAGHPSNPVHEIVLSALELQLLQEIRSLDGGAHAVIVVKMKKGRDGLEVYSVRENYRGDLTNEKDGV